MDRPQFGRNLLQRIADTVEEVGKVEFSPKLDGKNMIMVLAPDKSGKKKVKEPEEAPAAAASPAPSPEPEAAVTDAVEESS